MKKKILFNPFFNKLCIGIVCSCFFITSYASDTVESSYSTTALTVRMNNKTIEEVFNYIEKNSEYIFIYMDNVLDTKKRVNVHVDDQPLPVILEQIFKGTSVTYKIDDRQVTIRKENRSQPSPVIQQNREVSGVVNDNYGEPVIGANILIKGTSTGVITDLDGRFTLSVPSTEAVLVISYIGFVSQEVAVNNRTFLNINLEPSTESLDEVVVTALGLKRETKALGYSVQEIKGDAITEARESNLLNSLSGRMAGVQISGSGNGMGSSSRITIRGNNSIAGNNEPLVVVDGVPINSFNRGGDGSISEWGGSDRGNGLADINPDDIESISVLKGPAAAALYGARAGNGVLMVTTKKGTQSQGLGITLNSNVMFETPLVKPKMQNEYGQGTNGEYIANSNSSWGAKMEGQLLEDWTGQVRPYSAYDNDIMDFLSTGVSTTNTLEANAVNEKTAFRGTLSYQRLDGAVPANYQDKYNLNLRTTVNLSSKLILDSKVNYIKQKAWNRPQLTGSPENVMANYLIMPRNVHYSDLKGATDENGNAKIWTTDEPNYVLNPYYTSVYNKSGDQRDRFIGFISLQYDPLDWLSIKLRHGEDMYWEKSNSRHVGSTPYGKYNGQGDYNIGYGDFRERNTDALISAMKDNLGGSHFSGSLNLGGNLMFHEATSNGMNSGLLAIPDFFAISNGETITASNTVSKKSVNSIYGFAQLSYGNWVYLDVTARNDWSSTLPKQNRSFFYPSVGLGWVVSDMLNFYDVSLPEFISFLKLRGSYAEVGNDTDPYRLVATYGIGTIINDIKGATPNETIPLGDLKPEMIKSTELGFDVRFFRNRLGIDFSWYKKNATNQILGLPISTTTGKKYRMINAGNIQNSGVELVLSGTPVTTRDFTWDVMVNYSKNTNKIIELHEESSNYILASTGFINVVATEGGSYGDLYGRAYQRDDEGRILIDDNGLPLLEDDMNTKLGNYMPKWTGSLMNTFNYKNISLSFLLDLRYGGDMYVRSLARASLYGTTEMSLEGREAWYAGTGGYIAEGVNAEGQINTIPVNPQGYWDRVQNSGEKFMYSATNLRLRELSIGYSLPRTTLAKTPFTSMKISFVGRNLWLLKNNIPGYDPESSFSTGNGQGIEYASYPSMRSFGFNLNVSF